VTSASAALPDRHASHIPGGLLAVVRTSSTEYALTITRGLLLAGAPAVEVTCTVPDAPSVIAAVAEEAFGRVGAGTVRTPEQATAAVRAGAAYLVAPNLNPAVVNRGIELGVPVIPGALTPTELTRAVDLGASAVKLFPIAAVGGIAYLTAILEPLPDIAIIASGGIDIDEVDDYLRAGAHAVCLGPALLDMAAVAAGDVAGVAEYAFRVLCRTGIALHTTGRSHEAGH
jgi:2-dehydro-3-deoxyphosphogluconate aldolase/(4S)-4-hydroxy-2-oxoglutarate aldolase